MAQESQIPQQLMTAALLHFEQGVPISDCHIDKRGHRDRLARVQHVYWQWVKNPWLDTYQLFRQMVKGQFADPPSETRAAQRDELLFKFVRDHVSPPSRAVAAAKVRAVADRLMRNGMETDNGRDMADGAKIAMKLDRLDQPESEQADMAKTHFISPVVTIKASEMDDSKIDYDDKQSLAIMQEFGAYIDPKRQMVEDKVALLEAKNHEPTGDESDE